MHTRKNSGVNVTKDIIITLCLPDYSCDFFWRIQRIIDDAYSYFIYIITIVSSTA